ncbi:protein Flattop [Apteryx mantelli]|uniref:Protein Flattop n=1 Tax=Apteryx mantelli TaxID=2696672 RepID=A0ABM4FXK2_9AVES
MAARSGAGQVGPAAAAPRGLQSWSVPRSARQHPLPRDGYTQIIANDRGHLLPSVPRSKASPWGTFLGTWDMPLKIPPARLNLTSRSAAAAAQLTDWIHESTTLTSACNGLRPEITGKPQEPWSDTQDTREPSRKATRTSSKGTDLRLRDAISPEIHSTSREASPQQATSVEVSAPSWSGSVETKPKGGSSPSLTVSPCPGPVEASPRGTTSPEALVPSRSPSKAGCASRTRKGMAKREKSVSPERDGWTRRLPCSEDREGQTPHLGPSMRPGQTPRTRF